MTSKMLSEITSVITKGTTPTSVGCSFSENGINYIKSESITSSRTLDKSKYAFISEETHQKLKRSQIKENDILFSMAGMFLGKTGIVQADDVPANTNQAVAIIRIIPEQANYLYVYYYLNQKSIVTWINSLSGQSAQPNINLKQIGEIEIPLPDRVMQDKIAEILSVIDSRIELNSAINENLEQQAQALFKAWFVDFEPFGGVMPDDWQTKPISQLDVLVTDYVANGSFKSLAQNVEYQSEETDNVLIRLTDYNNNYSSDMVYITDSAYEFLAKSKLFGDEIIISNVGVNVGTVFRCPRLNKRMSLAPNSIMLRSDLLEHYLYLHFTSQYGQQQLQSIVTGSAQPKFNKTNFRSLSVLLPNSDVLESFNAIYTPIYNLIAANFTENQRLATLRDTLLPKLMNGEIDVSEVKI